MAVAIVQQQNQKPNCNININISNSDVTIVHGKQDSLKSSGDFKKDKENLAPSKKVESKSDEKKQKKNTKKDEKKIKDEIKKEVKKQKPVIKEVKLPVKRELNSNSENLSYNPKDFSSDVNKRLYDYERSKGNQSKAMEEAIRLHNGDPSNTCVYFQSACLRAIGIPVPNHIAYTSKFWTWLENNNWEMHRDFANIQKGDIIFAGEYHTMCFMGWKDKAHGIAYVMGNEAYSNGDAYANRNLNGQTPSKENGWNRQYKSTRYYKYKGHHKNNNSHTENTSIVTTKPLNTKDHNYTVTPLKGKVQAKQDVYVNEKPFPTTEGVRPVGLASGGDRLTVTGRASNGWYEVSYNGQKAYISHKYTNFLEEKADIKDTSNSTTPPKVTETNTSSETKQSNTSEGYKSIASIKANGGLWLHSSKDSYASSRLTIMGNGKKVEVLEEDGSWTKVKYNGYVGFCASKYLETIKNSTSNKKQEEQKKVDNSKNTTIKNKPKKEENNIKTKSIASIKANGGLWLHSSKDSYASSRLTIMGNGEKVEVLEEDGSWTKVKYNGHVGFCASQFLSKQKSQQKTTTKETTEAKTQVKSASIKANGGLWLHSSKDSYASSRLTIMSNGDKVKVLDDSNPSWVKVSYNGNIGYCAKRFLS